MNGTTSDGPLELATAAGECSPLQEFYNPNQDIDWLFAGIPSNCSLGGDAGGCIDSFRIGTGAGAGAFPAGADATGAEAGGTSGIIVDGISGVPQASSVYFTTLGAPGGGCSNAPTGDTSTCLVKRTQNGLQ